MLGRDVELGEVEVVGLDVGTFGDGKAHVGEDLDAFVVDLADGMDAPVGDGPSRTGSVTSARSLAKPLRQRLAFQRALRASSASLTRALSSLTDWPKPLRSSAGSEPSVCISSEMRPFLPSTAMRTCSMAARSPAAAMLASSSLSSALRSEL